MSAPDWTHRLASYDPENPKLRHLVNVLDEISGRIDASITLLELMFANPDAGLPSEEMICAALNGISLEVADLQAVYRHFNQVSHHENTQKKADDERRARLALNLSCVPREMATRIISK